jgi:signal transduction histidine kinase/CheY-like chemotaxis protein
VRRSGGPAIDPAPLLVACCVVAAFSGGWQAATALGAFGAAGLVVVPALDGVIPAADPIRLAVYSVSAAGSAWIAITARRSIERAFEARLTSSAAEVDRLRDEVREGEKLASLGRLTGSVVHDFNNLLTAIAGHAEMLIADGQLIGPARGDAQEIARTADRATALTQQLLAFLRRGSGEPRVIDLNDTVSGMEGLLRRLIGSPVELEIVEAPAPLLVRADPARFQMALLNLALNARDAMPAGGTLGITTARVDLAGPDPVAHPGLAPGRYALVTVSDTGFGMNAETRAHLFEPFFTTKPAGQGTGLGLSATASIVEDAGGTIRVESIEGRGSRFSVYLPGVAGNPAPVEADTGDRPASIGREAVLLVEDDVAVRTVMTRALTAYGYRVRSTGDGAAALRLLRAAGTSMDVLVADIGLPGISGTELAARAVERRPDLPIVLVTGQLAMADTPPSELPAGTPLLIKPFTPDVLAGAVREVLDAPARSSVRPSPERPLEVGSSPST